ncbi:8089_t:CDS:1, partial [Gigaspora rosea]
MLGRRGWSTLKARAKSYGAPAKQICACQMFEISNDNWEENP